MNHETTHPSLAQAGGTLAPAARHFSVQLSSTRRGARVARLLAVEQLRAWSLPWESAAQVIAELAANAAVHGVHDRDFRLVLCVTETASGRATLRIEVTDTRGDRLPTRPETAATLDAEARASGHGLVIVEALADRWGVSTGPVPRKTVWAELMVRE